MTSTTFRPGDIVRVVPSNDYLNKNSVWVGTDLTVTANPPHDPNGKYTHATHPRYGNGAFRTDRLAPVLREGDVVLTPSGEYNTTVTKLTKKGNAVVQYEDGSTTKFPVMSLRLVSRKPDPDEVIEELRKTIREQSDEKLLLERQQTAAQYANDQQLMKAGLVRVELLAQWDAKFTARSRETSLVLLEQLRQTITTAKGRN